MTLSKRLLTAALASAVIAAAPTILIQTAAASSPDGSQTISITPAGYHGRHGHHGRYRVYGGYGTVYVAPRRWHWRKRCYRKRIWRRYWNGHRWVKRSIWSRRICRRVRVYY